MLKKLKKSNKELRILLLGLDNAGQSRAANDAACMQRQRAGRSIRSRRLHVIPSTAVLMLTLFPLPVPFLPCSLLSRQDLRSEEVE